MAQALVPASPYYDRIHYTTSAGSLASSLLTALDSMSCIYESERDTTFTEIEANLRSAIESLLPKIGRPLPSPEYLVAFGPGATKGGHQPV